MLIRECSSIIGGWTLEGKFLGKSVIGVVSVVKGCAYKAMFVYNRWVDFRRKVYRNVSYRSSERSERLCL